MLKNLWLSGIGFYPGYEAGDMDHYQYLNMVYGQRLTEMRKPMWCLEYRLGSERNSKRSLWGIANAYLSLLAKSNADGIGMDMENNVSR